MAMRLFAVAVIALTSILLNGCGDDASISISFCSCRSSIDDITAAYGVPDEIEKYESDNYHCHTYWYWCKGFSIVFIWGKNVNGCCQESKNDFAPTCSG